MSRLFKISSLVISIFLLCTVHAMAFDESHLSKLKSTRECSQCDLSNADLSSADLHRANLYNSDLSGANLSGAVLSDAHLFNANLAGANLSRAYLSSATWIDGCVCKDISSCSNCRSNE